MASAKPPTKITPKSICNTCLQKLPKREFLTCARCNKKYDLNCANVSSARFYNTMTPDHKEAWICPTCHSKRKSKLHNTTTSSPSNGSPLTILDSLNKSKVTIRKTTESKNMRKSISLEDLSDLGDTRYIFSHNMKEKILNEPLTLQNINALLELNLQENNKSIISELRAIVQSQIEEALSELKDEVIEYREKTEREQSKINSDIKNLNTKISQLDQDLTLIKYESQKLKAELKNSTLTQNEIKLSYDPTKTFILYGLSENYWESNNATYDRVINAFYEILNVDLTGYIEEIVRLGKRGKKRPIRIELISKRMTNYLLSCGIFFKNTGLAVSEYLNEQGLKEKRILKEAMISARRNGQRAVFRNNKLVIDGRVTTVEDLRENISPNKTQRNSKKNSEKISNTIDHPINEPESYGSSNLQHNFRNFRK